MSSEEIRQSFLEFFKKKGHKIVPSSSLIPENDPTTLFTGSGMQPMLRYLLGEKHPLGKQIVDVQKCFRTDDIDEVGDNRHTTFFEMLGNWSLGDFFKKEQIPWIFEFLTETISLNPENIYVTVFRGNETLKLLRDEESVKIWQEVFGRVEIEAKAVDFSERDGMRGGRIFYYDEKKNWWSRTGVPNEMPVGEPGGPDSEIFWDFGAELKIHEKSKFKNQPCHVNCDCGRFLEIGNNVFMEYVKTDSRFSLLPQKNVDFGGGLERLVAAKNNDPDIFKTDVFSELVAKIRELAGDINDNAIRVFADHLRASVFLIADGLKPSNKEAGYILRRLLRRILAYTVKYDIHADLFPASVEIIKEKFGEIYPEVKETKMILEVLEDEKQKFHEAIGRGIKEIEKYPKITGKDAFYLYETFGLPFELIKELAPKDAVKALSKGDFDKEFEKHQELSRTASAGMFKGGLVDMSEQTIKLHTAAHLLMESLRQVLGNHVMQKGSNITAERLRLDFSHPEKLTAEEIKEVEDLVNQKIQEDLLVKMEEMNLEQAKKQGAMGVFEAKYGEKVKVYSIGDFSKEICGGPHVQKTGELGHFKIIKEKASSSGVRRIKAVLD
ncbi:alanine--tRNA ligase [Candidatus Wolfebacteria bacterium]|uniref:alanine--tRNA ligase n=2 Tax=Candidatus Wolfeibacteriota TaxID=1752735 RepID=A0A2M7Q7A6_9BACT|nr:alanine--tRNA ligase [Candidatus Wolfebacteria bacterium]PIY58854.1 MAG: alanine--tRNA ligase [Candidatus Wolfebacteria bacterium CG_4_10_14_0_8_um_filter_39_64]PJB83537.1 MAG: alanine--tRNA ligase [Candidatus Wolfebacteria bacterium CG_4_9_14_0_8_um_filter_39_46]